MLLLMWRLTAAAQRHVRQFVVFRDTRYHSLKGQVAIRSDIREVNEKNASDMKRCNRTTELRWSREFSFLVSRTPRIKRRAREKRERESKCRMPWIQAWIALDEIESERVKKREKRASFTCNRRVYNSQLSQSAIRCSTRVSESKLSLRLLFTRAGLRAFLEPKIFHFPLISSIACSLLSEKSSVSLRLNSTKLIRDGSSERRSSSNPAAARSRQLHEAVREGDQTEVSGELNAPAASRTRKTLDENS